MKAKTPQELKGLQQQVYRLIQDNPGIQNDDADLVAAFWRQEGWSDNRSLEDNIRRVTRGETICRRRRELHDMGLITYSPEAMKARTTAFRNETNTHSTYEQTMARIANPSTKFVMQEIDGERVMVLL